MVGLKHNILMNRVLQEVEFYSVYLTGIVGFTLAS